MNLSKDQEERLFFVVEEAGEVIQAAMKICRHGYDSKSPLDNTTNNNALDLRKELIQLHFVTKLLIESGDVGAVFSGSEYDTIINEKAESLRKYSHFQESSLIDRTLYMSL